MVRAGETAFAMDALERFGACVFAVMAGQFIRTGETPLTPLPRALVRLFSCMGPLVGLEMRTFGVDFFASGKLALVDAATFGNSAPRRGRRQTQRRQRPHGSGGRVPVRLSVQFRGSGGSDSVVRRSDAVVDQRGMFAIVGSVPVDRLECRNH